MIISRNKTPAGNRHRLHRCHARTVRITYCSGRFGHCEHDVKFLEAYIEDLESLELEDDTVRGRVSNRVIDVSADRHGAFSAISRILKPGGKYGFSGVLANLRIPVPVAGASLSLGKYLSGARG